MLAATQLGLVPPDVKAQQEEAFSIVNLIREVWPPGQREYKSEDVRRIATSLNRSIASLIDAITNAIDDPLVQERDDITAQAETDIRELQKFQRALALPVEQSRQGPNVDIQELRSAVPAMMDRIVRIWSGMNSVHDVFIGWIGASEADRITQGFRDILKVVKSIPGAKSVSFASRHKKNLIVGTVGLLILGGSTWLILRRMKSAGLMEAELLPAELPPPPVGIHVFGPEDEGLLLAPGESIEAAPIHEVIELVTKVS